MPKTVELSGMRHVLYYGLPVPQELNGKSGIGRDL